MTVRKCKIMPKMKSVARFPIYLRLTNCNKFPIVRTSSISNQRRYVITCRMPTSCSHLPHQGNRFKESLNQGREELEKMLNELTLRDAILLVFANKADKFSACSGEDVANALGLKPGNKGRTIRKVRHYLNTFN